jgi:hypothetical protein
MSNIAAALALSVATIVSPAAPAQAAPSDGTDPSKWPVIDTAAYTSPDDPGWVFFRAYSATGQGCGISPTGTVGCAGVPTSSASSPTADP